MGCGVWGVGCGALGCDVWGLDGVWRVGSGYWRPGGWDWGCSVDWGCRCQVLGASCCPVVGGRLPTCPAAGAKPCPPTPTQATQLIKVFDVSGTCSLDIAELGPLMRTVQVCHRGEVNRRGGGEAGRGFGWEVEVGAKRARWSGNSGADERKTLGG